MKRIISLLVAFALLLGGTGAIAQEHISRFSLPTQTPGEETAPPAPEITPSPAPEGPATLAEAIALYLDTWGFAYTYNPDLEYFYMNITLDSTLSACDVYIEIIEDGFLVDAYSPIKARPDDPDMMARMAEFIVRANHTIYLGGFEMNFDNGTIYYETLVKTFDAIPTQLEIEWLVDVPYLMMERFGDALAQVILNGGIPADVLAEPDDSIALENRRVTQRRAGFCLSKNPWFSDRNARFVNL